MNQNDRLVFAFIEISKYLVLEFDFVTLLRVYDSARHYK